MSVLGRVAASPLQASRQRQTSNFNRAFAGVLVCGAGTLRSQRPICWTDCLQTRQWRLAFLHGTHLYAPQRGRSVCWAVRLALSTYSKAGNQSVPTLHELYRLRLGGRVVRIEPAPGLQRSCPAQILVRPQLVVPAAEIGQELVEDITVGEDTSPQHSLQCPEETFHAPVLSGAVQVGSRMPRTVWTSPLSRSPSSD